MISRIYSIKESVSMNMNEEECFYEIQLNDIRNDVKKISISNELNFLDESFFKNEDIEIEKKISKLRRFISHIIIDKKANFIKQGIDIGYITDKQNIKILTDALVYITLKKADSLERIDLKSNEVIYEMLKEKKLLKLLLEIKKDTINFQNCVYKIIDSLDLCVSMKQDFRYVINLNDMDPNIKLAIQLYLLKGNFNWVNDVESEFKEFIFSKNSSLKDNARINCWEMIFYAMYKSDLISRENLKNLYRGSLDSIGAKIEELFRFKYARTIKTNINVRRLKSKLSNEPNIIMIDEPRGRGLMHDMISVPYTQKQIIKMLLTHKFDELQTSPKIYSHWVKWTEGIVGTVKKDTFISDNINNMEDVRKLSVKDFCNRLSRGI